MTLRRTAVLLLFTFVVAALIGCSSGNTPAEKQPSATKSKPKETVLYTAQEALNRLQGHARKWASDALPVHMASQLNGDSNGQGGKASVWSGLFSSPSRRTVKSFILSGSQRPDAPVFGVSSPGGEMPLTPDVAGLQFEPFFLKTDSDKAFTTAQDHGGAELIKKFPDQPVTFVVAWERKLHAPILYVIYGEDIKKNKGMGVINGTTGAFLKAVNK